MDVLANKQYPGTSLKTALKERFEWVIIAVVITVIITILAFCGN